MRLHFAVLYAALLAAQPALAQSTAAPAQVPLADFVHENQYYNPRLAPDGKHIAITERVPDGDRFIPVLKMYSLPDMKLTGAIRFPVFEVPANYYWASATRLVVAKGREFGSLEGPQATGEIVATDIDGKKQEYLFGYRMRQQSRRGAASTMAMTAASAMSRTFRNSATGASTSPATTGKPVTVPSTRSTRPGPRASCWPTCRWGT